MAKIEKHSKIEKKPQHKNLIDLVKYAYIRRVKKWMFCPACPDGKMQINRASTLWQCEDCGYGLSADEYEDDYVFWFCDECNAYLNNQEGFDRKQDKHICRKCGYENDTTFDNIKGICSDCGKTLPDAESTLCVDCRGIRREKAKKWLIGAGILVAGAILTAVSSTDSDAEESGSASPLFLPEDTDIEDDDEVYGLGPGRFPTCKTCGAQMTGFDGWAWYSCPYCEDRVRIIEGKETWYDEIFGRGKKQHYSDYDLADFCRGGDLSED